MEASHGLVWPRFCFGTCFGADFPGCYGPKTLRGHASGELPYAALSLTPRSLEEHSAHCGFYFGAGGDASSATGSG
eukprot:1185811-Pleurochrysis_carterae.AAC.1